MLNLSLRKDEKAMTLMELLVSMSVVVAIIIISTNLARQVKTYIYMAEASKVETNTINILTTYFLRTANTIGYDDFDQNFTLIYTKMFGLLDPTYLLQEVKSEEDKLIFFTHKHMGVETDYKIERDSHTFDIKENTDELLRTTKSMIITRCIPQDKWDKEYNFEEINALERIPVLTRNDVTSAGKSKFSIQCCLNESDATTPNCDGGTTKNARSKWRVRSWHVAYDKVKQYPLKKDTRYGASGAGFQGFFTFVDNQLSFNVMTYMIRSNCHSYWDYKGHPTKSLRVKDRWDCNKIAESDHATKAATIPNKVMYKEIKSSIHDSGVVDFGF